MKSNQLQVKKYAVLLSYLGTIPFLSSGLLCLYFLIHEDHNPSIFIIFQTKVIAHTYAVVILSFLSGIYWNLSVQKNHSLLNLLFSNLLVISMWFSLIFIAKLTGLIIVIIGLAFALWLDLRAYKENLIEDWYWSLRKKITTIVMISLIPVLIV